MSMSVVVDVDVEDVEDVEEGDGEGRLWRT